MSSDSSTTTRKLLATYTKSDGCQLSELVQYQCEVGATHIECNPFVRLFLRCPNKPTIEVTPEYDTTSTDTTKMTGIPDFGSVVDKKSPPGFAMMEEQS